MGKEIDWTKAPEGATHYDPSAQLEWEGWMKFESGEWFVWNNYKWESCSIWVEKNGTNGFLKLENKPNIVRMEIPNGEPDVIVVNGRRYIPEPDQC